MKKLILLLPFIFSCSSTMQDTAKQRIANREISSLKVIRIIQKSVTKSSYDFTKQQKENFRFRVFKYALLPYKNEKVEVSIKDGSGKLNKSQYYTDKKGYLDFEYTLPEKVEKTKIAIYVEDKKAIVEFFVTRPEKYEGTFSLQKSSFSVDKKNFDADGESTATFKFITKSSQSNKVKAYGQDVVISGESIMQDMREVKLGVYIAKVKLGKKSGRIPFVVKVNDVEKTGAIYLKMKPVVDKKSIKVKAKKSKNKVRVYVEVKDLYGDIFKENINLEPVAEESLTVSSISSDNNGSFYYDVDLPSKSAHFKFGVKFEDKVFMGSDIIEHVFYPIDTLNSKIEYSEPTIPSGVDSIKLSLSVKDKAGNFIELSEDPILNIENGKVLELENLGAGEYNAIVVPKRNTNRVNLQFKAHTDQIIAEKEIALSFDIKKDFISDKRYFPDNSYLDDMQHSIMSFSKNERYVEGFSIRNRGPNKSVPDNCAYAPKGNSSNCSPERTFHFEFREQARQNIGLRLDDNVNEYVSHTMHSEFIFFPRKLIPNFEKSIDQTKLIVTITTGEQVVFDASTHEIIGGVLEEGPIDVVTKSRHSRKFPNLRYKGSGVVIRVNGRGQTPSQGQFNQSVISGDYGNIGGRRALIYKYDKSNDSIISCKRPKSDLWEQGDISPIPFKFATDAQFDNYLKKHCSFSLYN